MENSLPPPLIPNDIKEAIYALFDECLNTHTPFHRKLDIFVIPDALAQRVQEATGIDVFGHLVCIDNFGILHTLEQHGNPLSGPLEDKKFVVKEVRTVVSTKKKKVSRLVLHTMYKIKVSK